MHFLSANIEGQASGSSNSKSEPDADVRHSSPSSPRRRASTSAELDRGLANALRAASPSEPVFIKSLALGIPASTPAIRIRKEKPESVTGIFPISRAELGAVWQRPEELSPLEITVLEGGWHSALVVFRNYVDYPEEYLLSIMSVLRTQKFLNEATLQWTLWHRACHSTNEMLYAPVTCAVCKILRSLSIKTLYSVNEGVKQLAVTCGDMGLVCNQPCLRVMDVLMSARSVTNSSTSEQGTNSEDARDRQSPEQGRPSKELPAPTAPRDHVQTSAYARPRAQVPPPYLTTTHLPFTTQSTPEHPAHGDYVTWSQVAPLPTPSYPYDAFAQQQYYDPYDATQAAPEHFISGHPIIKFSAPDPSPTEINEYRLLEDTSQWREMFRDFTKWSDAHKEAQYNGEEDIAAVFRWSTAMRSRFLNPRVTNNIARAELASATLTHRARAWWLAHRTRAPQLLVTFEQLLEWIKRELVPHSSTTDAVNAWSDLSYTGDPKKYISDLERLINHFPLRRESIIIMATKPLGREVQKRVQLMNLQHGPTGITLAQLKQAILSFLSLHRSDRLAIRDRDRQLVFAPRQYRPNSGGQSAYQIRKENIPASSSGREQKMHALPSPVAKSSVGDTKPKTVVAGSSAPKTGTTTMVATSSGPRSGMRPTVAGSPNASVYPRRKIGTGPTPCFVCGTDKHAWIDCPKKKKGRCACCGSDAHITRWCAQRYFPEVRMTFHTCVPDEDRAFRYIPENDPDAETDESAEPCDETEVEECENEASLFHEVTLDEVDEEALMQELDEMKIQFHAQGFCCFGDIDPEEIDIEEVYESLDSYRTEAQHEMEFRDEDERGDGLPDCEFYDIGDDGVGRVVRISCLPPPEEYHAMERTNELLPVERATCPLSRFFRQRLRSNLEMTRALVDGTELVAPAPQTEEQTAPARFESALGKREDIELVAPSPKMHEQVASMTLNECGNVVPQKKKPLRRSPMSSSDDEPLFPPTQRCTPEFGKNESVPPTQEVNVSSEQPKPPYLKVLESFKVPTDSAWNNMMKVLHNDSFPHMFPIRPPNKLGQLLYKFCIEGYDVTTLLDLGASHSFVTRNWAMGKGLDLVPIRPPRPVGLFSGHKNHIRYVAMSLKLRFKEHVRTWKFYVIDAAPFPAVLGADAILSWPIFFSPLDYRIFIIPELFHAKRTTHDLGGVYEIWANRDGMATAKHLAHQALELEECETRISFDRTPTTSEDEAFRAANGPMPVCFMNLGGKARSCSPWQEFDTASLWLCATDGFSDSSECEEDNLLQLHTVTASGDEEKAKYDEFIASIDPKLRAVVESFPQLFAPPDTDPPSRPVKHYIYVSSDTVPAARRAYRLGDKKREAMFSQMKELIAKGWVVPSASPWAAPILFVPKDNGTKLRMCVDFRDLNALTKKDAFPLPRIDLLLHKANNAKIFSKLDLASSFHQIEVHPAHRELTSFILPEAVEGCALWEWKVMPFGLVNAPSTFQRAMSYALRGCEDFTAVYIDDVLIFSETIDDHLEHLRRVFQKLQDDSYHVRLAKCQFMSKEVRFLGHILSEHGIRALDDRQECLDAFQPPFDSAKKVRSFLGVIMWFKTFIAHVATIAAPLFPLTSAKKKWTWTQEATQAVEALKQAVLSAPTLVRFDRALPTRVTTDASSVGIGAMLEQQAQEEWKPVAFWSRKLKDPETRYSATDIEWLAVVDAVTLVWRHFLEDKPFTVRSDHKALERKLHKSAHEPPISNRQARWIERLMPFSLTFEYIPGEENKVADALSRFPYTARLNTVTVMHSMLAGILPRIKVAAEQDAVYQSYLLKCRAGTNARFRIEDGILILGESNVYVPNDDRLRTLLLSEFGVEKTVEKLKRFWFWPGMVRDVEDYVASCSVCQKTKHGTAKPPGLLQPIRAKHPWHIITLDFVGKFAPGRLTGNTMCLVLVDKFSKYVVLESVPETVNAEQTADVLLKRVITQFGVPEIVISDRGPQFSSEVWQRVLKLLGSQAALASAHHPQTDGQSERAIQTLLRLIRAFASEQENLWEELLPLLQFALNDTYCSSTKNTPFRVLYGCDPVSPMRLLTRIANSLPTGTDPATPLEWEEKTAEQLDIIWKFVRDHQEEVAERMKARYDRNNRKALELQPGDLVLLSTKSHKLLAGSRKHRQRYVGPYIVQSKINDNAYRLTGLPPNVPLTQNVRFLVLFKPSPRKFSSRPTPDMNTPDVIDGEPEWEVENIEDERGTRGQHSFLVKWAHTPQRQWLPLRCLTNCGQLLRDFYDSKQLTIPERVQQFLDESAQDVQSDTSEADSEPEVSGTTRRRRGSVVNRGSVAAHDNDDSEEDDSG